MAKREITRAEARAIERAAMEEAAHMVGHPVTSLEEAAAEAEPEP